MPKVTQRSVHERKKRDAIRKGETPPRNPHTDLYYARVDLVMDLIVQDPAWAQLKRRKALTEAVAKILNVGAKMARIYIKDALDEWERKLSIKVEDNLRIAVNQRNMIFKRAYLKGEYGDALRALKDRDILQGIYVPKERRINDDVDTMDLSSLSAEEVRQAILLRNKLKDDAEKKK